MTILDDRAAKAIQEAMDARVRALSANHPTTHMAEVIEIDQAGVTWVHILGGADRTPAIRSLAQVKKGDLVTVTIEDGVVTINGSSSNPAASVEYVEAADYAIAEYAKQAMAAVLGDVLQVKEAIIGRATIEDLTAVEATVQTLTASYANLNEIVASKATIVDLNAATARISQLEADDVTINGKITAAEGRIGTIESDYLKTADMDTEVARVGTLLTGYAEADLANVNNAWIQNGVIKDAAITNEMVGSLSANKLTAGTINGANINVTNLNADNITTGTINGQRIGTGSLSLDKLSEDVYTETEVDAIVDGLNDRIDGAIETHTGTVVPTLNNSPASSWNTTDLKDEHVGDVYYVVNSQSQQNGYCYRFTKTGSTYSWQLIKDSDVTAALSRLETAEGKITTFDSDISTLKTDTGELKTKTQTLETSLGDKVDTSTFNELSSTVDENSSTITSMSTVLTNNGLTSSTNITNTVNTMSQTASSNSSVISQLASTLGTNADGTTKAGDIVHRTSAVEQDLSTFKTTVSSTYATQTSVENAQADATNALNRQVAYSATSATAASTVAKVATCTNFPALAAGVTVTVRFSTANTSTGAVTLNVNSTGAKTIYVNGAATASGNQILWSANANVTFTYDGTYWRVVSEPRTWYGTCSTAAATAAKTATINEIVVCKGTVVKLNMTYENTSTSATMNLTSTGAKNLYYGTTTTRPTTANGYGWGAASTATFVFDGQYWRVGDTSVLSRLIQAETTISSHTTSINQNAEAIALKANSSEVYTKTQTDGLISTEVTNRNAAITAASNSITASVEETYATKTALVDGLEDANDYTDSEISSAKTEIKATTDGITSEVSKISSAKYVNSSTTSWTLPNIKTYAAEGHSENWNVESTVGFRVGDTVYIKSTDSTRNCTVYIKTTVTAVLSSTRFTGTSHGYEDVLPVETIKSTINQSSDSVKIQAKHVEIDGTAIFNSISSNVDSAITSKGYATTGQVATAKSEAISSANSTTDTKLTNYSTTTQMNTAISTAVDNIDVGGRNLLKYTAKPVQNSTSWNRDQSVVEGWSRWSTYITCTNTDSGIKGELTADSVSGFVVPFVADNAVIGGVEYTLSFDYRTNLSSFGSVYLLCASGGNKTANPNPITASDTDWQHYEQTLTWASTAGQITRGLLIPYSKGPDKWIEIRNRSMKLERGNVATDWTPAPEDMVTASEVGALEPPYTEVEWVESNGKQYVYLDWKPPMATWGFEADFLIRNTFNSTQAAWNTSTNANNAGFLFGTQNSSNNNDIQVGTYSSTGYCRIGGTAGGSASNYDAKWKKDKSRQQIKLHGTTLTRADGTTTTVVRASEVVDKPYCNMTVFAYHTGVRKSGNGSFVYPSTSRIYSLKFYEGENLKVDLVGAIRKSDGVTGLYDKVAGKFHPAPSMTYGNVVGDLGTAPTVADTLSTSMPEITIDNMTDTRMWRGTVNLDKLEDGQQLTVTPRYAVTASIQTTELAGWDDTTSNSNVYLKLTLADNSTTEWIPCYYKGTTRLTTHFGSGQNIIMTYRENVLIGASATAAGSSIAKAFFGNPGYYNDTNDNARYVQYYNSILTKAAVSAASIIAGDNEGKYSEVQSGSSFDLAHPILWITTALAANKTDYSHIYTQTYDRDLATCYNSFTGAVNSIVFIVGTVEGNTFTVDSSVLTCTVPTTEDGKFYIPIGRLGNQSNGKNYFNFQVSVPVSLYAFLDGEFRQVTPTEVVSEQYVYCQSDTVLDVPSVPSAWVSETGESVSEDEGMRSNYLVGTEIPLEMTANYQNVYELSTSIQTLATDEDITVTFKAKADIARWIDFYFVAGSTAKNNTSNFYPAFHLTTDWAWYTYSGPAGADIASVTAFRLRQNASQHASGTTGATIEVSDLMLTRGGAIVGPLWTTKRPTYRKLYPVTFVAKQTKRLDGTITCTTPIPDDTTTVIDGGRIITGTVDASVVNVVNLNADNITSGTIDAQRIRSGSITVSMFSDDVSEKFALTENVEESLADMGDAISDMGSDLGGQISAVSANAQAAASTAEAASTMAASLDATVNGTSSTAGLVDRMRNVETHINLTTIGQGADSQPAIILDASGGNSSGMEAVLTNTQLAFRDNGETVSYISNRKQYITDLEVTSEAQFGNFAFIPMSDGSLAFKWLGGDA